jgi:hypothetical protein
VKLSAVGGQLSADPLLSFDFFPLPAGPNADDWRRESKTAIFE